MAMTESVVSGIVTFICGGALTGLGAWVLRLRDQSAAQRRDVVGQLQAYSAALLARVEQLESDLRDRAREHDLSFSELHARHVRCEVECEGLRQRIDFLQGTVDNLRAGMDPVYALSLSPIGNIITDDHGTITDANPYIVSLFHWFESELRGKNIRKLIPARYHAIHDARLAMTRDTGVPPDDRVLALIGLTKQGQEFPCNVKFEAWKDGPQWVFSVMVWRRNPDAGPSGEIPTFRVEDVDRPSPPAPVTVAVAPAVVVAPAPAEDKEP